MVKQLNESNFEEEVLKSSRPVLVDFYADWCGPCKMTAPVVEAVSESMKDKISAGKVNVDENPNLATNYKVMSIPLLVLFKDGKSVGQLLGAQSKDAIEDMIVKAL